jgi:eukaryotic-like serine/threonine-protein kinase
MSHSAAEIRIGTVLRDTYELTSVLGKGGMGAVFLARHLRLPGKQVAVKILHTEDELSEEQFARFRREAEIASQLGHPNIVEVLDFHSLESGTPYLVMEYLRGESLAQRLRKGRLSMREAFSIARQMGSALHAAHRAGVVHRDLKPANVLLVPTDSEGLVTERVKLLDFGISKLMGSQTLQTQDDVLIGTPRYMSPEQAMGRNREIDARTDLFALGCIVYEMLSGDSPFAGGTIAEVVYRVVHEHPESLATRCPDLPARAVLAVERALAKNPKERYQDVGTFIAELTGTPLQTLSGLGPDPTPFPPRGALRPADPGAHDESGTDATLVPSRLAEGGAAASGPAPQAPGGAPGPSVEAGSTLAAFRAAEPAPAMAAPSVSASRRPTDLELPAVPPTAAQPSAAPSVVAAPAGTASAPTPSAAPAPAARSSSKLLVAAGVVVLLLGVGVALGTGLFRSAASSSTGGEPSAVAPPAPPATPQAGTEPPETPPTSPSPDPTAVAQQDPPTPVTPPTPPPDKASSRPTRPTSTEVVPAAVRAELDEAERALSAGNHTLAIRTAQRTLATQKTEAAYLLIGRAYCQLKDLSNARAQWRNLSRQGKDRLGKYCKQYDVNLD